MLRAPLRYAYRLLGRRYPRVLLWIQLQLAHFVVAGGVGMLTLYVDISGGQFLRIFVVSQALVFVENLFAFWALTRLVRPADPWLRGDRTPDTALAAWRALAGLPLNFLRYRRYVPIVFNVVPISAYVLVELDYAFWPSFFILAAGSSIVLLWGVFLRFFGLETIMRPVLQDVSRELPDGARLGSTTLSLRWRMLLALPSITIISGVAVVGLAGPEDKDLSSLGVGVLFTLAVAFTISLELSALLTRSVLEPIRDLRRGTDAVAKGDYSVRVPVMGTDETGQLAGTFNRMVAGLEEREKLHAAFGAFVAPELADRVMSEGTVLAGEEVEVTVLFLDIRDFTAFAERASPTAVVARLNEFFDVVVPLLAARGGHANKFVGDGLLGVFGAPDRLPDHADRAVAAALDIARTVQDRYGEELRIGIGVNTGPVVAGTIGGGGRVEFTVIGDPVNTAARVEELTRDTGDGVLLTEATVAALRSNPGELVERGVMELKGKRRPVALYAPARFAAPGVHRLRAVADER